MSAPFPIKAGEFHLGTEPHVRIGVILTEDALPFVDIELPAVGAYEFHSGWLKGVVAKPERPMPVRLEALDGKLRIVSRENNAELGSTPEVRLVHKGGPAVPGPGDGVLVRGVVAGRGFHWAKRIDQTLTGVLEFRAQGNHVMLINELPLEEYLTGVITGEMSGECPPEFMKAQATAARSWLLGQPKPPHPDQPFIWCNDDCCQRYQGTGGWSQQARDAIQACRGEVLITPSGYFCDARYSKNTGGISEDALSVWKAPIECLDAVIDAPRGSFIEKFFPVTESNIDEYLEGDWLKDTDAYAGPNVIPQDALTRYLGRVDEHGEYFRWRVPRTHAELVESLSTRGGIEDLDAVLELRPRKRGRSGRIEILDVVYLDKSGKQCVKRYLKEYDIRAALSKKFLFSSAFALRDVVRGPRGEITSVTLLGAGWGHGAGLCQMGALGRAFKGQDYRTILLAYFTGARLERAYD
jgi:stage II sporulation protein D